MSIWCPCQLWVLLVFMALDRTRLIICFQLFPDKVGVVVFFWNIASLLLQHAFLSFFSHEEGLDLDEIGFIVMILFYSRSQGRIKHFLWVERMDLLLSFNYCSVEDCEVALSCTTHSRPHLVDFDLWHVWRVAQGHRNHISLFVRFISSSLLCFLFWAHHLLGVS